MELDNIAPDSASNKSNRNSVSTISENVWNKSEHGNSGNVDATGKDGDFASVNLSQVSKRDTEGIGLLTASFFILGEVAGGGMLSLPNAIKGTGYIGVILLIYLCCSSGYLGQRLGACWVILEERFEKYRKGVQSPYPTIAQEAYGTWAKWVVQVCNDITMFGGGVVFLSLSAELIRALLSDAWCTTGCIWQLIIFALLLPLSWLGSPKDFWQMAVGASISIIVAAILVFIQCLIEADPNRVKYYPTPTFNSFSLAFGAILFAFGGASAYPTIQNDMKNRSQFTSSVIIAFIGLVAIYIPVACAGYFIFGYEVQSDITMTLDQGVVTKIIQGLVALHLLCAFVIVMNPVFQDMEGVFRIKPGFSLKRTLSRTVIMFLLLFVSESIPDFGKILNLIGGSTITLTTFVLPPLFYMKLCSMKNPAWPKRVIPLHEKVFLWELILIGIVGGVSATYSAVQDIIDMTVSPCYVNIDYTLATSTCSG